MEGELVSDPLGRNLGFHNFGKHTTAPGDARFAFNKIGNLWSKEIQADLKSDDEAELESLEGSNVEQDAPEEMKTEATVPNPARQEKKRLREDQIKEAKTAAKRAKTNDDTKSTTASFLKASWKDTQESADKMFLTQGRKQQEGREWSSKLALGSSRPR
jgi:hypothetical protein